MNLAEVLSAVGAPGSEASFSLFAQHLDPTWVEEALRATGTATIRKRKLPAEYAVWLVIGMALFRDRAIEEVVRHLDLVLPTSEGQRQPVHHLVSSSEWSDEDLLKAVAAQAVPALAGSGETVYWIIDDTGLPKKGTHSVGVARQYCGQTGKTDNCRVAVSLSLATPLGSLPLAYALYLPREWTDDPARCERAGVPDDVGFSSKNEMAARQIRGAVAAGHPAARCWAMPPTAMTRSCGMH